MRVMNERLISIWNYWLWSHSIKVIWWEKDPSSIEDHTFLRIIYGFGDECSNLTFRYSTQEQAVCAAENFVDQVMGCFEEVDP